jgi:rhamnose transport system substrate-binding protein
MMNRKLVVLLVGAILSIVPFVVSAQEDPAEAEPGQEVNIILLPKFLGIAVFDEANMGAEEAHAELENSGEYTYTGPTAENSVAG